MMVLTLLFATTAMSLVVSISGVTSDTQAQMNLFERSVQVQGEGCQNVRWTVDTQDHQLTMYVESAVDADWVGIGLSENGGMKGADVAIVRVDPNSSGESPSFVVEDRVSVDFVMPTLDLLQNVELLSASYQVGEDGEERIVATIRRGIATCDNDDLEVIPSKQYLICASGQIDPMSGDISYHGPSNAANAHTNLLVDEELLFEANLSIAPGTIPNEVSTGVTIWGDPSSAVLPFPVDIQMPRIEVTDEVSTSYICTAFELPFDIRLGRTETVWDNGVTMNEAPAPSYLHHQNIFRCPDTVFEERPEIKMGKTFPCFEMPSCTTEIALTRGSSATAPPALSLELLKGPYIMQIHYENKMAAPIKNDRSGFRLWTEPPMLPSQTNLAQTLIFKGHLPSLRIPADPNQKDYSLQFLIPGSATNAFIPRDGVQVIGMIPHMHEHGVRAKLQVIRDGVHIMDAIDTLSFDFAMQAPIRSVWKLLPGDSLIFTCTYRPDPTRDILGGLSSSDHEMCLVGILFAPRIEEFKKLVGTGYTVKEGESFNNFFLGPTPPGQDTYFLDYALASFLPSDREQKRDFVPLKVHSSNFCELAIRDQINVPKYSFAEYNITAMFTLIVSFLFCYVLALRPVWSRIMKVDCDERVKRNTIVYLGQLVFGTIALPLVIIALVDLYHPSQTFAAVDPNTYTLVRGLIAIQVLIFLIELFYRLQVRIEVILHHLITAALFIILLIGGSQNFGASMYYLRLGLVLILMALTDHPLNFTLLLKNLGYAQTKWWPKLCQISGIVFVATKLILTGMAIYIMANKDDNTFLIPSHSFSNWLSDYASLGETPIIILVSIFLFLLLLVQIFIGYVMWKLGNVYKNKLHCSTETDESDETDETDENC